jgi:hypothetical protein
MSHQDGLTAEQLAELSAEVTARFAPIEALIGDGRNVSTAGSLAR